MDRPLIATRRRLSIIVERHDSERGDTAGIWLVAAAIVAPANTEGLPGASVSHGNGGFGPGPDRPTVMIVPGGEAECIKDFATGVARSLPDALITIDDTLETLPAERAVAMSGSGEQL